MNALSPVIETTEAQMIEEALDAVLTAAAEADRRPPLAPERGAVSAAESAFALLERMDSWTKAQAATHDLLSRPVSELCRQAVTTFGERLFEIGGMTLMQDALYRLAERDPANYGRRVAIMDHRWDGIGRQGDSAGWCA